MTATPETPNAGVEARPVARVPYADDEVLLLSDVSRMTGLPESTWRTWRFRGKGPQTFKLGTRVGIMRSDFEAWMDEQRAATSRGGDAA